MGIGGQYAAINSAIDEMMPSKYRGRVDIWINGSYWAGAIIGSIASLIFLNAFAENVGWRLAFLMGPSWPWSSSWWDAPSPRALGGC
jgi:MFS family permease